MPQTNGVAPRAAMVICAAMLGCSGGATDSGITNTGSNSGTQVQALPALAFSPTAVAISVGGTVTWVFGSVGHTVAFDAVAGHPGDIPGPVTNSSVSRTFATAGTYTYHCNIHPSMTGSVQVGETVSPPPPPTPPPPPPPPYGGVRKP